MSKLTQIANGGVTSAQGFRASGVAAAVKYPGRKDVALIAADAPCAVAGMFTTNQVAAAPVLLSRTRAASGRGRAVIANSGCANACTGEQGLRDAREMARVCAEALGATEDDVLVCSTGVVGVCLPMDRIASGAKDAVAALSPDGGADAAKAIMTTDTVSKEYAVEVRIDGKRVVVGGMCKGSGMIEPRMATMLAFVTTDAAIDAKELDAALREAVEQTFNRVVVDGDQSTNDTIVMMASAVAGNTPLTPAHADWPAFCAAVREVCDQLARMLVMDGEGATKFVTVRVKGAASPRDAQLAARAISKSALVKTSWFGLDPNWGRVMVAAGYSGAKVDDQKAQVFYGDVCVFDQGRVCAVDRETIGAVMKSRAFDVTVDLHLGDGADTVYTCDFSYDYVKINAEYTT